MLCLSELESTAGFEASWVQSEVSSNRLKLKSSTVTLIYCSARYMLVGYYAKIILAAAVTSMLDLNKGDTLCKLAAFQAPS